MYAINLARYRLDAGIKTKGLFGIKPLVVFTSDQCHYSLQKGAAFMGIGMENVVVVKSDAKGAMVPMELEKAILQSKAKGQLALMINATVGTTVLGAVDPLDAIADIAAVHGLWLHADACLGGAFLLSPRFTALMKGIERCDSVTWNWHKIAGAPHLAAAFLTKHKGLLKAAHGYGAEYLFKHKYYDPSNDRGDVSIMCGRKGDALKVWLMMKARGAEGLAKLVEAAADSAALFADKLRHNPRFQLVVDQAQLSSVTFWVIPPKVAALEQGSKEYKQGIEKAALTIKERMVKSGEGMVAYQPMKVKDFPSFFRVTVAAHPGLSPEDMDRLVGIFERHSEDL